MKDLKKGVYCVALDDEGGFCWQGVIVGEAVNEQGRTILRIAEMSWLDDSVTDKRFDIIADYARLCIFSNRRTFDLFMRRTYEIEDKLCAHEAAAINAAITAGTLH